MTKLKLTIIASALVVSGSALAASDGTLGTSSAGESIVTIIKDNAVLISDVNDIDLGAHAALAADAVESDDVCIFSSTTNYNVTIDSANGGFRLMDGTEEIPYGLTWSANGGTAATVADGTAITGLAGNSTSLDCASGTNATFEVTVASADFNSAVPGSYSDTLTLTVAPE
jgi:spore coat protein U-like protein